MCGCGREEVMEGVLYVWLGECSVISEKFVRLGSLGPLYLKVGHFIFSGMLRTGSNRFTLHGNNYIVYGES